MSYLQLLNPKGHAKEKSKKRVAPEADKTNSSTSKSNPPLTPVKFDPKSLLAPKTTPTKSKATPSTADNSSSATEDSNPGVGSFMERQFNLGRREEPAAKKRKSEIVIDDGSEDDERKKARTAFTGATNGGLISSHLNEQRKKAAAESGPNAEPIDLTKDDDEPIILGATNNDTREVVLGRIPANAMLYKIPNIPQYASGKVGKDHWPQLRVLPKRSPGNNNTIELWATAKSSSTSSNYGIKFGTVEAKIASVLCPLMDGNAVNQMRLKLYVDSFPRKAGEFLGGQISRSVPVSIIVIAPRNKADGIGKIFSQRHLHFHPPFRLDNMEYYNPHEPKVLGTGRKLPWKSQGATVGSRTNFVTRTQEEMLKDTTSMFDSLVKTEDLPEKEANQEVILTPLLSHQKQALYFLTDHERGNGDLTDTESKFSLWKPLEKKGREVWYNVITNHEVQEKPQQTRGGILADVMGLGKTLSILALLSETPDEARSFGEQDPPMEPDQVVRNSKATLIICPKSVMTNWQEQIKLHTKSGKLKVYSYHGSNRTQDVDELAEYDVVLTTYQTAAGEFGASAGKMDALASINWFRVVLDEAHQIRNQATRVSKGCCSISAQRRWAVTGTPVQNRLDDLGALIKFLGIKPFDDGTSWQQHIIAPFKNANEHVIPQLRLLVDSITLRRMKDSIGLTDRTQSRVLLSFTEEEDVIYREFAKQSNIQLRVMLKDSNRLKGKSYAHVLKAIGRLRAICAHGKEMLSEDDQKELEGLTAATAIDLGDEATDGPDDSFISERQAYDSFSMMVDTDNDKCAECGRKIGEKKISEDGDEIEEDSEESSGNELDDIMGYLTPCYHLFCSKCKDEYDKEIHDNDELNFDPLDHYLKCKYCEQHVRWAYFELTRSGLKKLIDSRSMKNKKGNKAKWDEGSYSGEHTKVKALLNELRVSESETAALPPEEPPIRSVVFSGWTTYLDLIEYALDNNNIGYVRLDGSMSIKARTQVLQNFAYDPTITVLLVSIKAGGQGLNFTAANKVYMMEPQFNPGVEAQAIDRVHRLGQKRDVQIKHFIMVGSLEEKIVKLQEKKEKLAQLSMERKINRAEESKKKIEELRELFK